MGAYSILIVDDEPQVRDLLQLMLQDAGHTTVTAADGREAVDMMASRKFDIVLTDLLMPERDGLEFIADIRKNHPAVRIVAMSGGGHIARDSYLRIAKGFGAHVLLPKPFDHAAVIGAIEAAGRLA